MKKFINIMLALALTVGVATITVAQDTSKDTSKTTTSTKKTSKKVGKKGTTTSTSSSSSTTGTQSPADLQNTFLTLLVTQLKNQDPSSPTDSTTFVTQLAQFQQLEQSVNTGQDVAAIRQDIDQFTAANTTPTSSNS